MRRIVIAMTLLALSGCSLMPAKLAGKVDASGDGDFLTQRHNLRLSSGGIQLVNTGTPNAGNGDTLYNAFTKINGNTTIFQNMFPSGSGLLISTGAVPNPMALATFSNVVSLFGSGSCTVSSSYVLAADGSCQLNTGGGTVTTTGSPSTGAPAAFSGAASITPMTFANLLTIFTSCGSPSSTKFLNSLGQCATPTGAGTVTSVGINGAGIASFTGVPITASGTAQLAWSGNSGGIPYFSSGTALSSSAALIQNELIIGGGVGAAPFSIGTRGTTSTVLIGNASGAPSFGPVNLATMVTGVCAPLNGCTGENNASNTLTLSGPATFAGTPTGNLGFLETPVSANATSGCGFTAGYTAVIGDSGKLLCNAGSGAITLTIPANSAVPYPVGTWLFFLAPCTAGTITIAITSDTMYLAGSSSSTGSRTLTACGGASAFKYDATTWMISGGSNLT